MIDSIISYIDLHGKITSLGLLSKLLSKQMLPNPSSNTKSKKFVNIATSTITPACTTTQVLFPNASPCVFPQCKGYHCMLSKSDHLKTVADSPYKGKAQSIDTNSMSDFNAMTCLAQQRRRPKWIESHMYVRAARSNSNHLRIVVMEANMMRAAKIVEFLKPRRSHLSRRKDDFIWGRPSTLARQ